LGQIEITKKEKGFLWPLQKSVGGYGGGSVKNADGRIISSLMNARDATKKERCDNDNNNFKVYSFRLPDWGCRLWIGTLYLAHSEALRGVKKCITDLQDTSLFYYYLWYQFFAA
jgi:hypothetical protein